MPANLGGCIWLQIVKIRHVSHEMLVLLLQHVSSRVSGFAMSVEEAAKRFVFEGVKVSNLEDVSHEMLALMLQHVWSRVCGFPLASLCL